MASSNFLTWDSPQINIESDAQYVADSLRSNGAPTGAILPSPTFNKFALQTSIFAAAFCEMLANNGFSTSDANQATLAAVLDNIQLSSDVLAAITLVPFSPSVSLNAGVSNGFFLSLSGNMNITAVTGLTNGQLVAMYYLQDSAGGHIVTFPTTMFNATPPDTTAGAFSLQLFRYDGFAGGFLRPAGPLISDNGMFSNGVAHSVGGFTTPASAAIGTNISFGGTIAGPIANIPAVHTSDITTFTAEITTLATIASLLVSGATTMNGVLTVNAAAAIGGLLQCVSLFTPGNANIGSLQIAGGAPAGQVLTGNGSTYVPQPLPAAPVLTFTRNDVTGDRNFNTTYTNPYGMPMTVTGYGTTTGSRVASVQCFVNGIGDFANTDGATVDGGACGFSFEVPTGATYEVVINSLSGGQTGVTGMGKWIETTKSL